MRISLHPNLHCITEHWLEYVVNFINIPGHSLLSPIQETGSLYVYTQTKLYLKIEFFKGNSNEGNY
jgi:hypothetical protein